MAYSCRPLREGQVCWTLIYSDSVLALDGQDDSSDHLIHRVNSVLAGVTMDDHRTCRGNTVPIFQPLTPIRENGPPPVILAACCRLCFCTLLARFPWPP